MEKGEKNVMVVDDDASIINVVKKLLEPRGISVVGVTSGNECLAELENGFRGVVLMDVVMPNMDGWDTIKEIVDRGYKDRVIISMLTGKGEPDKKMDNLKEYVLDYIKKPFSSKNLVTVVEEYLGYLT